MSKATEEIVEEINELDRQIGEKGMAKEEHAPLTATQEHLPQTDGSAE